MRGLIPKRNRTNVDIAAKVSQHQAPRFNMRGLTPKRNRTKVTIRVIQKNKSCYFSSGQANLTFHSFM